MKITDVQAHYLRLPSIQARTDSSQDALIVQVDTDAGITGWGEADGCPLVVKAIIEAPMSHTLVNHNFTTDINTAASLNFLAAVPNALVLEYCVEPSEISRGLAKSPFKQIDGYMVVPDEPGLGFEPNMEVIGKYLVRS